MSPAILKEHRISVALCLCILIALVGCYNSKLFMPECSFVSTSVGKPLAALDNSFSVAAKESFGFFTDIPDSTWALKKNMSRATNLGLSAASIKVDETLPEEDRDKTVRYYTSTWNPDFACPMDVALGPVGDGHKWVCDAHRLATIKDCLVYSVGSNGVFGFEKSINDLAPNCEIHIFDPDDYSQKMKAAKIPNSSFHVWGLKGSNAKINLTGKLKGRALDFKSLEETMKVLGHAGRAIHVFKIDCEGCEWSTYEDWLSQDVRQILVETHGWNSRSRIFFSDIRKAGFVMTHKESNILTKGNCMEYAFLKLAKTFFN